MSRTIGAAWGLYILLVRVSEKFIYRSIRNPSKLAPTVDPNPERFDLKSSQPSELTTCLLQRRAMPSAHRPDTQNQLRTLHY